MNILIVEDEERIARRTERYLIEILSDRKIHIHIEEEINKAMRFLENNTIDLLFLDLNLHGENGFQIIQSLVSESFQTIIISAYSEKAIEAFEYGVLDFIAKPFLKERLEKAIDRYKNTELKSENSTRYLSIKSNSILELIEVNKIIFIKGAGHYSELHLENGKVELHSKNLEKLYILLPDQFKRVHKSYIANIKMVDRIRTEVGSKYSIQFKNTEEIPIGRSYYKGLKKELIK